MPFNPAIPQATNLLSNSQGALLTNNGFLNTWSNVDHYALDDATVNNGKHQVIQMPVQTSVPVTTNDPVAFSYQQPTGNAGVLQYLGGPNGAVASPILPLQSSAAGITIASLGTSSVFDFTNLPYCYGWMNAFAQFVNPPNPPQLFAAAGWFYWNGSTGTLLQNRTAVTFIFQFSGSILQLINTSGISFTLVSWTIGFDRIFTPL